MIYTVFGLLEEIYHTPHNDYKVFNRYCLTGCLFHYSDYVLSMYKTVSTWNICGSKTQEQVKLSSFESNRWLTKELDALKSGAPVEIE